MSEPFTADEIQSLRQHGIALFAERVLIEVQPPMSEARIAEIEAACAGPLPDALRDLWRLTAGGELAYDLHARMDGNEEALSWSELFYDGSDHYRDLAGWIEHEQECADEAAADDAGRIDERRDRRQRMPVLRHQRGGEQPAEHVEELRRQDDPHQADQRLDFRRIAETRRDDRRRDRTVRPEAPGRDGRHRRALPAR